MARVFRIELAREFHGAKGLRLELQARALGFLAKTRQRRQHAARKYVFLNEIRTTTIIFKTIFIDRNDLQHSNAAWTQTILQILEVSWPISLTDRLQHFDRDDPIEGAADVPVVLQADI